MLIPDRLAREPLIRVCPPDCEVHGQCENPGKRPVHRNDVVERLDVVTEWVENGGNAGLWLGGTSLVVVDLDGPEAAEIATETLPVTYEVETGSGWYHRYYSCWAWTEVRRFGGCDLLAGNQMVVIPPSTHPSGGTYSVNRALPVAKVSEGELAHFVEKIEDLEAGDDGGGNTVDRREPRRGDDLDELDELIHHDERRAEVRRVLRDRTAGHNERCWLAGFLSGAVGLSAGEVVEVIDRHNRWRNYDRETTRRHVKSVIQSSGGGGP